MNERILVVDDEVGIVEFLEINLIKSGFSVEKAYSGKEALEQLKQKHIDLVLLDLMLPDIDGFEVCKMIRQIISIPIIMLTAKGEDIDKILGLETGADDYIVKPFNPREVIARIHAIFRRLPKKITEKIIIGPLTMEPLRRKVWIEERTVDLSPKEYDLLLILAKSPGVLIKRDELIKEVWETTEYIDARSIDVYIKHLRNKLRIPGLIRTVWGHGYQLVLPST